MYVDSHCHLNFPELAADLPAILERMAANQVTHALVVSVNMPEWPGLMSLVEPQPNLWASVGVHPDYEDTPDPEPEELARLAAHPKVVAIGETG
ncbi:TatD family hydrolase, partial [Campylobacter coli]